jgi:hypothetical protein
MTAAVAMGRNPGSVTHLIGWRRDREVRQQSQHKRAALLEAIAKHPDADPGLRRQAEFYRRRLEAGLERHVDAG